MEAPPFMCERSSKARVGVISETVSLPRMISSRKRAFSPAAAVVPGRVL